MKNARKQSSKKRTTKNQTGKAKARATRAMINEYDKLALNWNVAWDRDNPDAQLGRAVRQLVNPKPVGFAIRLDDGTLKSSRSSGITTVEIGKTERDARRVAAECNLDGYEVVPVFA